MPAIHRTSSAVHSPDLSLSPRVRAMRPRTPFTNASRQAKDGMIRGSKVATECVMLWCWFGPTQCHQIKSVLTQGLVNELEALRILRQSDLGDTGMFTATETTSSTCQTLRVAHRRCIFVRATVRRTIFTFRNLVASRVWLKHSRTESGLLRRSTVSRLLYSRNLKLNRGCE